MPEVENYRVFNGCHNCAHVRDESTFEDGYHFFCTLWHPEYKDEKREMHFWSDESVDPFGTCDDWQKGAQDA